MLLASADIGHKGNVNIEGIFAPDFQADLADSFKEGLAFNIAGGAAHLGNDHVRAGLFAHAVDEFLDFVGDVRNYLNRFSEIFAPALFVKHVPVDLAGGKVGIFVQILVDKALIVAKVKVGFGAVLRYINLAVLIGAHGAGVNVNIRVKLLRRNLKSPCFQKPPEGRGGYALAKPRNNAACYKNVLCHVFRPPVSLYIKIKRLFTVAPFGAQRRALKNTRKIKKRLPTP